MNNINNRICFTVSYKGENIRVCLTRKRVKNINLRVKSDLTVEVSAAGEVPLGVIEKLVKEKGDWILKHFAGYAQRHTGSRAGSYLGGEKLKYLGSSYNLLVQPALNREAVLFDCESVYLLVRDGRTGGERAEMIEQWYREKAELFFSQSLERIYSLLAGLGVAKPELKIRKMKTRWGSCSLNKRKITLNLELIKMPPASIDYVLLHELVHFVHHNHSRDFYNCLNALMPDWKERRRQLKEIDTSG